MAFRTPLRTSRILRDQAGSAHSTIAHDQMLAASVVVLTSVRSHPYVHRWIEGLLPEGETITGREDEMHDDQ